MKLKDLKKYKLSNTPGVYFFLKGEKVLYIGKATSLKDRVKSYFNKDLIGMRGPIILDMVFQADKIKWEKTDSVLEALILEAELIKKNQPKYNTKEKSDKSFNYVCITDEEIPKVLIIRGRELVQKKYENFSSLTLPRVRGGTLRVKNSHTFSVTFGPYTNGSQLKEALKIIRRIFPFIDESSSKKQNQEFYKQLGLVPKIAQRGVTFLNGLAERTREEDRGPEKKKYLAGLNEYKKNIRHLKLFFRGKKKDLLKDLQKEMKEYAKKREFEKAGEIKRQIFALKHINDVALIKGESSSVHENFSSLTLPRVRGGPLRVKNFHIPRELFRIEAYDVAHMSGRNMVGVMTVIEDGEVNKNEYRKFKINTQSGANDTGALAEIINRRLMHTEWQYPNLMVVDGGKAQINTVEKIFKIAGIEIPVVSVLKDENHKPKNILGRHDLAVKYEQEILLANSEAHRFAITYHKQMRGKNFLK